MSGLQVTVKRREKSLKGRGTATNPPNRFENIIPGSVNTNRCLHEATKAAMCLTKALYQRTIEL